MPKITIEPCERVAIDHMTTLDTCRAKDYSKFHDLRAYQLYFRCQALYSRTLLPLGYVRQSPREKRILVSQFGRIDMNEVGTKILISGRVFRGSAKCFVLSCKLHNS